MWVCVFALVHIQVDLKAITCLIVQILSVCVSCGIWEKWCCCRIQTFTCCVCRCMDPCACAFVCFILFLLKLLFFTWIPSKNTQHHYLHMFRLPLSACHHLFPIHEFQCNRARVIFSLFFHIYTVFLLIKWYTVFWIWVSGYHFLHSFTPSFACLLPCFSLLSLQIRNVSVFIWFTCLSL